MKCHFDVAYEAADIHTNTFPGYFGAPMHGHGFPKEIHSKEELVEFLYPLFTYCR